MSTRDLSLQTAHQHAANAEDYRNRGLLIPASEEHTKAAEAFHACEQKSQDVNTKNTLRMLHNEHVKAGKELQRRISKLREENQDPTLPQKTLPRNAQNHSHQNTGNSNTAPPVPVPVLSTPMYASSSNRLLDSYNFDESFMVLGQRSDPGDAFNNFWRIMEGMLDNLSQPVAFATAPLGTEPAKTKGSRRDGSSSDIDGQLHTTKQKLDGKFKSKVDISLEETDEEVFAEEDDELSESFYLIPSDSEPSRSVLKKENASLKRDLDVMAKRLAAAERVMQLRKEQDQQLRESIVMARHQAQRVMGASTIMTRQPGPQPIDLSALNINLPAVPAPVTALNVGRDREAQLLSRIRELEEEVRNVRAENEKQKTTIARFRERWEKLKESSKRKKDAKAAAEVARMGVGERIVEEPEVEQMLDEASGRSPT